MNVCIIETACPTHLTVMSRQSDAVEKPCCRLTREALRIEAAMVRVIVRLMALDRNVAEGIRVSSVNATEWPSSSFPL
jgi:hypothetical protein